jgi:hypothetical protein
MAAITNGILGWILAPALSPDIEIPPLIRSTNNLIMFEQSPVIE